MRILILNWRDPKNPQAGGAEIVTLEHAKAWVAKGHTVTWFASHFPDAKIKEIIEGVEVVRQGNSISVYLLAPIYYLFHRKNFDIVIDEIHGIPFFTPLYVGKPKIAFIHEVAAEIWDYMFAFPINKIGRWVEPLYFRLYKHIPFWTVAPSAVKELAEYGIEQKQCAIIYNGITNDSVKTLPKKENVTTYLFISRLVKMKGIEEIIKAFGFIHKEDKKTELWIVGYGEKDYMEQLEKKVREYHIDDAVVFWGSVDHDKKLELMQKAHVLLHASIKEGWGLVVIEAASQGTPAIVYNVAGLCDSVQQGKTGIVLQKNSPDEMAREALLLTNDTKRYEVFQKHCLEWAKKFTWKKATEESLQLLEKVVNEER